LDYRKAFRVKPSQKLKLSKIHPAYKGKHESEAATGRRPTKSASSTAAASLSAGGTANSWRKGVRTSTSLRRSFPTTRPELRALS
jgi:hypothetical protein